MPDDIFENHPEVEIPLDGSNTPLPEQPLDKVSGVNLGLKHVDLKSIIAPTDSNEQILDKLLNLAPDSLIPWETCVLPSRGLYYSWGTDRIKIRAMNLVAEKYLATQRLAQTGENIDYVLRHCCEFPSGFDVNDLLIGDKTFILYYLRGITYGNMYEFLATCNNCSSVDTYKYDINELAQTITYAKQELGQEPFKLVLPYISSATGKDIFINIRFMRSHDLRFIMSKRRTLGRAFNEAHSADPRVQNKRAADADTDITENLERIIVSVMGVSDPYTISKFVSQLHAHDTAYIREWLKDNTPGINSRVDMLCKKCSAKFTIELPLTESFFRPAKSARDGK